VIAAAVLAASLFAAGPPATGTAELPVPVIRQAPERCGQAALAMVLRYYGADSSVAEAERAYDRALRGSLITDLAAAARRAGFEARVAELGEDSLRLLIAARVPPVLLVRRGAGPLTVGHYGVVIGWDPDRERYAVNDGGPATRHLARADLMRRWRGAGSLALIVRPRP
jgi:ABC-type bacteriocin/lantibiotic exporter with double-glycine peptidase domain